MFSLSDRIWQASTLDKLSKAQLAGIIMWGKSTIAEGNISQSCEGSLCSPLQPNPRMTEVKPFLPEVAFFFHMLGMEAAKRSVPLPIRQPPGPMKPIRTITAVLSTLALALPLLGQNPPAPPPVDPGAEPDRPERPARELSDHLQAKLDNYKKKKDELRKALEQKLAKINNPTRAKIKQATKEFEIEQKPKFDAQKALAAQIKVEMEAARPERPAKPQVSPEVKTQVKTLQNQSKAIQNTLKTSSNALKVALKDATREEAKQLKDAFREEQKDLHDQMKDIQRQIRETLAAATPDASTASATRTEPRRPPSREEVEEARRTSDK